MPDIPILRSNGHPILKNNSDTASERGRAPMRSRRQVLGRGAFMIGVAAALGGAPTSGRANIKIAKAQAGYKDTPVGGNECDRCIQFQPPSSCKIVDGSVRPSGSCNYFAAKPK
jgi:hypothetical protein